LKSKALQDTIAWECYRAPANDDAKYIVVLNGYGLSSGRCEEQHKMHCNHNRPS